MKRTVSILPWFRHPEPIEGPPVWFRSFDVKSPPAGTDTEVLSALKSIIENYKDLSGRPLCRVTVAADQDDVVLTTADGSVSPEVRRAVEYLAFSALAENEYFSEAFTNTNSARFQCFFHNFTPGADGVSLRTRRRDGYNLDGRSGPLFLTVPPQVSPRQTCGVDLALYRSLTSSTSPSPVLSRIRAAIPMFNASNSDADFYLPELEPIGMAGAFDAFCEKGGSRNSVAEEVSQVFAAFTGLPISKSHRWSTQRATYLATLDPNPKREEDKQIAKAEKQVWTLLKLWAWDFYRYRSKLIHGDAVPRSSMLWSPLEHDVAAAHIFPLMIRVALSKEGLYTLEEKYEDQCLALERRLDAEKWAQRDEEDTSTWNRIGHEAAFEARLRRI